jgi:hypothetical protein
VGLLLAHTFPPMPTVYSIPAMWTAPGSRATRQGDSSKREVLGRRAKPRGAPCGFSEPFGVPWENEW